MKPVAGVVAASALLSLLLVGCDRASEPPTPTTTSAPATDPPPAPAPTTGSTGSVAAGTTPPSDATIPPDAPPGVSKEKSADPSQASPKEPTQGEQSASMPLPGQVNDHSNLATPDQKK